MALKSTYPTADDIPEGQRNLYSETPDGKYVLDVEDIDAHPKVSGVIRANKENARKAQERLAKVEELEGKLSGLPDDFDADEWTRLRAGGKPDAQEQQARAVDALRAKHKADIEAMAAQLGERDQYIDGQARRSAISAALDESGFDPVHKDLLADHLAPNIKVRREDDGRRVAYAETDMGEVSALDFVAGFAAKSGQPYLAKASGPGAPGSGKPGAHINGRGDFGGSREDRQKAISAKFPELGH